MSYRSELPGGLSPEDRLELLEEQVDNLSSRVIPEHDRHGHVIETDDVHKALARLDLLDNKIEDLDFSIQLILPMLGVDRSIFNALRDMLKEGKRNDEQRKQYLMALEKLDESTPLAQNLTKKLQTLRDDEDRILEEIRHLTSLLWETKR